MHSCLSEVVEGEQLKRCKSGELPDRDGCLSDFSPNRPWTLPSTTFTMTQTRAPSVVSALMRKGELKSRSVTPNMLLSLHFSTHFSPNLALLMMFWKGVLVCHIFDEKIQAVEDKQRPFLSHTMIPASQGDHSRPPSCFLRACLWAREHMYVHLCVSETARLSYLVFMPGLCGLSGGAGFQRGERGHRARAAMRCHQPQGDLRQRLQVGPLGVVVPFFSFLFKTSCLGALCTGTQIHLLPHPCGQGCGGCTGVL